MGYMLWLHLDDITNMISFHSLPLQEGGHPMWYLSRAHRCLPGTPFPPALPRALSKAPGHREAGGTCDMTYKSHAILSQWHLEYRSAGQGRHHICYFKKNVTKNPETDGMKEKILLSFDKEEEFR